MDIVEHIRASRDIGREELEQLLMNCMDTGYRQSIAQAGQKKVQELLKNSSFDNQIANLLCEL